MGDNDRNSVASRLLTLLRESKYGSDGDGSGDCSGDGSGDSGDSGCAAAVSAELERCIYNGAVLSMRSKGGVCSWKNPRFQHAYASRAIYIMNNIEPIMALVRGAEKWPVWKAAEATPQQLRPDIWDELMRHQRAKDEAPAAPLAPNTDTFKCKRCRSRKCYYYELQTRSGDEPMTVFVTCTACLYKWRVGG